MPTAAKLVAAGVFFIVGWIAANAYVPILGVGAAAGFFRELVGLLGALIGWRVMGAEAGNGYRQAIGSGLKTSILLVFFALLLFSVREMVFLSMKMRYDGPMNAVLDVFKLMLERGQELATGAIIGTLVIGGIIGGIITEKASRRWS